MILTNDKILKNSIDVTDPFLVQNFLTLQWMRTMDATPTITMEVTAPSVTTTLPSFPITAVLLQGGHLLPTWTWHRRSNLFLEKSGSKQFQSHSNPITSPLPVQSWSECDVETNTNMNSILFLKMKQIGMQIVFQFQKTVRIYSNSSNYSNMNTNSANSSGYLTIAG